MSRARLRRSGARRAQERGRHRGPRFPRAGVRAKLDWPQVLTTLAVEQLAFFDDGYGVLEDQNLPPERRSCQLVSRHLASTVFSPSSLRAPDELRHAGVATQELAAAIVFECRRQLG